MKLLFAAASAAILAAAVTAVAAAQAAPATGAYGTIGYADTHGDGVDLGTIQGRLGWRFNEWLGAEGELAGDWMDGYLFSLSGPIYAGTNEIQRNVVAERLLGLPR